MRQEPVYHNALRQDALYTRLPPFQLLREGGAQTLDGADELRRQAVRHHHAQRERGEKGMSWPSAAGVMYRYPLQTHEMLLYSSMLVLIVVGCRCVVDTVVCARWWVLREALFF